MIQVQIKTNTMRKTDNFEITDTPASVLEKFELSTAGATVNLNGTFLPQPTLIPTLKHWAYRTAAA